MSTTVSIGFSQHPDPAKAILQACVQVKNVLNSIETDLLIVLATPPYVTPEVQSVISRTLKPKHLVGSSTGGLLLSSGIYNHGITLIGINSTDTSFGISAVNDHHPDNMYLNGFELARKAGQGLYEFHHREGFIIFSNGMENKTSTFVRGIKESLGVLFPVLGAVSSTSYQHKKLYQFYQDQILQNATVGLLWGGSTRLAIGCKHGFKPLGKPRTVTKVDGGILRTIDHGPAVNIYSHFLGNLWKSHAALYPLGFYLEEQHQYLLRNPIDFLPDGSIVCHEGIPEGAEVHLMINNSAGCITSATEAARLVKASLGERQAKLVLIFESLARHKILGSSASAEIAAIKSVLGHTTPLAGMCSFGELAPFGSLNDIKNIYLHNESILILALA